MTFDSASKKFLDEHPDIETTSVTRCGDCGLYYKPSLGHKCKGKKKKVERNCKDCFHYDACKEVASHNGYRDISYTESQCKHFVLKERVVRLACRCEECVYFREYGPCTYACHHPNTLFNEVAKRGFCSQGIRKGGEGDGL